MLCLKKKLNKEIIREIPVIKSINKCIWKGSIQENIIKDENSLSFSDFIRLRKVTKIE
jgi:hypothetical protein